MAFSSLICTIMTGAFGVTLIFFLGFHLMLVYKNKTTLEMGESPNHSVY